MSDRRGIASLVDAPQLSAMLKFLDWGPMVVLGLLLVVRPELFFKGGGSESDVAKRATYLRSRRGYLRKIGYVLIAAGSLLGLGTLGH